MLQIPQCVPCIHYLRRELVVFIGASLILPGCLCGEFKEFAAQINVLNKNKIRDVVKFEL
jgi:hypothetical protein